MEIIKCFQTDMRATTDKVINHSTLSMHNVVLIITNFFTKNFIDFSGLYIINIGIMCQQEWRRDKMEDFLTWSKPNKHLSAKKKRVIFPLVTVCV